MASNYDALENYKQRLSELQKQLVELKYQHDCESHVCSTIKEEISELNSKLSKVEETKEASPSLLSKFFKAKKETKAPLISEEEILLIKDKKRKLESKLHDAQGRKRTASIAYTDQLYSIEALKKEIARYNKNSVELPTYSIATGHIR